LNFDLKKFLQSNKKRVFKTRLFLIFFEKLSFGL